MSRGLGSDDCAIEGHLLACCKYSPTSVVDDLLDDTTDVPVSLRVVVVPELGWVLVQVGVGLEDPTGLSLRANDTTPGE